MISLLRFQQAPVVPVVSGPATKDSAMVSKKGSKGNPKPKGGFDSVTIASAGMM